MNRHVKIETWTVALLLALSGSPAASAEINEAEDIPLVGPGAGGQDLRKARRAYKKNPTQKNARALHQAQKKYMSANYPGDHDVERAREQLRERRKAFQMARQNYESGPTQKNRDLYRAQYYKMLVLTSDPRDRNRKKKFDRAMHAFDRSVTGDKPRLKAITAEARAKADADRRKADWQDQLDTVAAMEQQLLLLEEKLKTIKSRSKRTKTEVDINNTKLFLAEEIAILNNLRGEMDRTDRVWQVKQMQLKSANDKTKELRDAVKGYADDAEAASGAGFAQ